MKRSAVLTTAFAFVLLAGGCSSSAPASPSSSPPSPLTSAAPTIAAPSAVASPGPTISPAVAPTAPAVPTLGAGEPWLTYEWFPEDLPNRAVFVARPDGSDQTLIAADVPGADHRGPTWSPDGSKIALVSIDQAAGSGTLYVWDVATGKSTRLFDPAQACVTGGAFWPAWSPDGTRIAFVCYSSHEQIAVADIRTGAVRPLVTVDWPEHFDNPPTWSPDGKWIVFDDQHWDAANEFLDGSRIGKVAAGGGDVEWLNAFDSFAAWADWHPTDDLISYNTYDLGQMHEVDHPSDIYFMRSDGSHVAQLTDTAVPATIRVAQARWSSDGSTLVASCALGNPVFIVHVCYVDPGDGAITYPNEETTGARPELRPTR